MSLETKREQTPDLYASAKPVAFGHDGAVMAAQAAAAGSVGAIDDQLSERDKRMLAIGTLAGAAAAIARARFPFEQGQDALERTDLLMEHAASVGCQDHGCALLFTGEEVTV